MKDPSPFTHLIRLGLIGIIGLIVFLTLVYVMSPKSWNYDMSNWYRTDALEELQQQPLVYGGIENISTGERNVACVACHEDTLNKFQKLKHKKLSCESCHGPLIDHAQGDQVIAEAVIDRDRWQCLNCHEDQVNKPPRFPVFQTIDEEFIKHRELMAGEFPEGTTCLKCHDAHDPTP